MDPTVDIQQRETYEQLRERFTWKNHYTDDGIRVLSRIEKQLDGWCLYYAVAITMGSNFRVQSGRDISFSFHHLKEISDEAKQQFPNITAAKRLLKKLFYVGVLTKNDYVGRPQHGCRYCVRGLRSYDMSNLDHIRDALYELQSGGPLLAVIKISQNYEQCYRNSAVYKYDPNIPHGTLENPATHALTVVSFALENGPFFECQDSHGVLFGDKGFLKVDITSVKELYSFRVVEVLGD